MAGRPVSGKMASSRPPADVFPAQSRYARRAVSLRATALELPATWGDEGQALARVDRLLAEGPPGGLVLLPEASLTGYVSPRADFDLRRFAEPLDGPTARALAALAARHRVHLVGPLVERDGARHFNAMVGFGPDGARFLHYRKRNPWYPETWATPGDLPFPLVEVNGLTLTLALCFDAHFLAEQAADQLAEADALLFASAWVEDVAGTDTRAPLLASLARSFSISIVNANWAPGAVALPGQGGSAIYGPDGAVLARAKGGRADASLSKRGSLGRAPTA